MEIRVLNVIRCKMLKKSLLLSVSVCNLLKALLVCISEPFWDFKPIVYLLNFNSNVLNLVVGISVLLFITYSITL